MADQKLRIVLSATDSGLQATVQGATGNLVKLDAAAKKSSGSLEKYGRTTKALGSDLRQLAGAFGLVTGAAGAIRLAGAVDDYNRLQARIQQATRATGDYAAVSAQLTAIQRTTGASLRDTVSVFQSLARTAPELGVTNREMLTLTSSVEKLGVISGASTSALSAGLLQFSQAMASGVVRAEEFNSILENLPELANTIAVGMGKTTGELRNAVLQGDVLSRDVLDAVLSQTRDIEQRWAEVPESMRLSGVSLSEAFTGAIAKADQFLGITRAITQSLQGWSAIFDQFSGAQTLEQKYNELVERRIELQNMLYNPSKLTKDLGIANISGSVATKLELKEVEKQLDAVIAKKKELDDAYADNKAEAEFNAWNKKLVQDALDSNLADHKASEAAKKKAKSYLEVAASYGVASSQTKLYQQRVQEIDAALAQQGATAKEVEAAHKKLRDQIFGSAKAHTSAAGAAKDHTKELERLKQSQIELAARYGSTSAQAQLYAQRLAEVQAAMAATGTSSEQVAAAAKLVYDEIYNGGKALKDNAKEFDAWQKLAKNAVSRLDDAFIDMWRSVLDGTKTSLDSLKDLVKQMLAEIAHQLLTANLVVPISAALGVGGTAVSTAAGAASTAGTASNLLTAGSGLSNLIAPGAISNAIGLGAANLVEAFGASTGVATGLGAAVASAVPVVGAIAGLASILGGSLFDNGEWSPQATLKVGGGNIQPVTGHNIDQDYERIIGQIGQSNELLNRVIATFGETGQTAARGYSYSPFTVAPEDVESALTTSVRTIISAAAQAGDEEAQYLAEKLKNFNGGVGELGDTIATLISDFDNAGNASVDFSSDLQAMLQSLQSTVAGINQAIDSIGASFGQTIEDIKLRMLSDADVYAYLRQQAESTAESIKTLTDPGAIEDAANRVNDLVGQILSGLSDEQLKAGMGQGIIDFLGQVSELAQEKLAGIRDEKQAQYDALLEFSTSMGYVVNQMSDAASAMQNAAAGQKSAASAMAAAAAAIPRSISVTLRQSSSEIGV